MLRVAVQPSGFASATGMRYHDGERVAQTRGGRKPTFLLGATAAGPMTVGTQCEPAAWEQIVARVVEASGLELVKAELKGSGQGRLLRVYIDQPAGVGLGDCERVSRALSTALDAAEAGLESRFTLEVSSPGLDRPLAKLADCGRFAGQRAEVRTREPWMGSRRFVGRLLEPAAEEGVDCVRLQPENGPVVSVAWSNVAQAHLAPQWPSTERRPGKNKKKKQKKH